MTRKFKTEIRDGHIVIVYTRNNEIIPTAIFPVGVGGPIVTLIRVLEQINADPHCIHDIEVTIVSSDIGGSEEPQPAPSQN